MGNAKFEFVTSDGPSGSGLRFSHLAAYFTGETLGRMSAKSESRKPDPGSQSDKLELSSHHVSNCRTVIL